jgi:nucleotide-binding universal stress UspA family protein
MNTPTPPVRVTASASDPSGLRYEFTGYPRSGRIVVGLDGSDASEKALRGGIRIATALNTTLQVVSTWTYPTEYAALPSTSDWSPENDANEILASSVGRAFVGVRPPWVSVIAQQGRAADTLIEFSRGAEMLVVGSRGHGGLAGLLLGSVSTACAEHASCPVLVMH